MVKGEIPIHTSFTDQYPRGTIQSPVAVLRYVDHNEHSYASEYQVPAAFVGNASNIHTESYRAPPLGYSESKPTDRNFFTAYRDLGETLSRCTAIDETWFTPDTHPNDVFMYSHSERLPHPEISSFQDSDYQYDQEVTTEAHSWGDGPPYNDRQDLARMDYMAEVHADNPTDRTSSGTLACSDLLIMEASVDLELKNFWRPQRWT
jgi:hypothetical protein